jgi:mono/diheme cytochrome c family protein
MEKDIEKHRVRPNGMPALGETRDDQALWNIAAFVKTLPALKPEDHAAIGSPGPAKPDARSPNAPQTR